MKANAHAAPAILDSTGRPFNASFLRQPAHEAADLWSNELRSWQPNSYSADGALLPELETLRARSNDSARNNGFTSGAIQTHLDSIIGGGLRLSAKPSWRVLGQNAQWARTWAAQTEAAFWEYAEDIDRFCDASQRQSFGEQLGQGYRSYLQSFEILATLEWKPGRPGAKYPTCIQMIDPVRLCNPNGRPDSDRLRGGIEFDGDGVPLAAHFVSHVWNDPAAWGTQRTWKRVPFRTPWGRTQVIHVFDAQMPDQSRGINGLVSVLSKIKMLDKFEHATLQAAILNAMYAAVIQSSMDWEQVGAAIGVNNRAKRNDAVTDYMSSRATFHGEAGVRFSGVKIPHLFPGEELKMVAPQHPGPQFAQFEEATLRYLAAGFNLSYEQLSRDYSKTNYSSARASMLETWRYFLGRRKKISSRFATLVYACWLEEAIDMGVVEIPAGAPKFLDAKTAWSRCEWIGPGRGHVDPEKEANATEVEYGMMLTTLENEAAERGLDWEEVIEQRAVERDVLIAHGFDPAMVGSRGKSGNPSANSSPDDEATTRGERDAGDGRTPPTDDEENGNGRLAQAQDE